MRTGPRSASCFLLRRTTQFRTSAAAAADSLRSGHRAGVNEHSEFGSGCQRETAKPYLYKSMSVFRTVKERLVTDLYVGSKCKRIRPFQSDSIELQIDNT